MNTTNQSASMQTNQNGSTAVAKPQERLRSLLADPSVKQRFEEVLKTKAAAFMSSIMSAVSSNPMLTEAEPKSILMSAMVAATLDLPINPNLGFAWMIPYKGRDGVKAQFQLGYKGFIQLAMRTGQYKKINCMEIRNGQLRSFNPLSEEYEFDFSSNQEKEIIGFVAYFKMLNGFEKTVYWNVQRIRDHAKRYSKSFSQSSSSWTTNFPEMAMKTVLKNMLSKYGILSIELQKAVTLDQAVVKDYSGDSYENVDHIDVSGQAALSGDGRQEESEQETQTQGEAPNGPGPEVSNVMSNLPDSSEL